MQGFFWVLFIIGVVALISVGLWHIVPAAVSWFFWLIGWPFAFIWNLGPHEGLGLPPLSEHQALACLLVAWILSDLIKPESNVLVESSRPATPPTASERVPVDAFSRRFF